MVETLTWTVDLGIKWCHRLKQPQMKEWAMTIVHWRNEFLHILKWWEEALLLEAGLSSTGRKRLMLSRSAHHRCHCCTHRDWRALMRLMTVISEAMYVVLVSLMLELNEVFGFSNRLETRPLSMWIHSIILCTREGVGSHEWRNGLHTMTPGG
jgi:hypothetical protein